MGTRAKIAKAVKDIFSEMKKRSTTQGGVVRYFSSLETIQIKNHVLWLFLPKGFNAL